MRAVASAFCSERRSDAESAQRAAGSLGFERARTRQRHESGGRRAKRTFPPLALQTPAGQDKLDLIRANLPERYEVIGLIGTGWHGARLCVAFDKGGYNRAVAIQSAASAIGA